MEFFGTGPDDLGRMGVYPNADKFLAKYYPRDGEAGWLRAVPHALDDALASHKKVWSTKRTEFLEAIRLVHRE